LLLLDSNIHVSCSLALDPASELDQKTILVCNQPPRSTQPSIPLGLGRARLPVPGGR